MSFWTKAISDVTTTAIPLNTNTNGMKSADASGNIGRLNRMKP